MKYGFFLLELSNIKWVSSQSSEFLILGIIQKNIVDYQKYCGQLFVLEGTLIYFSLEKKTKPSHEDLNFFKLLMLKQ